MTQKSANRLPAPAGRLLDRDRPLHFSFESRPHAGYAGDTIASALAANGVSMLSRSFKYHRPRGIVSLVGGEANTLVTVNGIPNVLSERHFLEDGDNVVGQNYSGSLNWDRSAWISAFGRFLPIGFYYRAFFRPRGAWAFWEPIIRRRAGLGRVNTHACHGYFDKVYLFADVAVVGGGPAGLAAAIAAGESGARVVLIDENPGLGGALGYARFDAAGRRAETERERLLSRIATLPNIEILTSASCEGVFADNWLSVVRGRRLHKVRAERIVLATGAIEQPAIFRNNDLPGIMFGSASQRLIQQYGVKPGRRAVVLTANDDGYGVALDLMDAGTIVEVVIDLRDPRSDAPFRDAVRRRGTRILASCTISQARGRRRLEGVTVHGIKGDVVSGPPIEEIKCDLVCTSVGYAPNLALAAHSGAMLAYDTATAMQRADNLPTNVTLAGSANRCFALDSVIADGTRAGSGATPQHISGQIAQDVQNISHPWPIFPHSKGKEFVDFDEDLTLKDIHDTISSGFEDIQLLKRYSTVGMGPSQGRHSAVNAIRIAARARHQLEDDIGTTTARPPYSGESFGVLAGRSFDPVRRTPMHHRHAEAGARMMVAGSWMRPAHYGAASDVNAAIVSEIRAVRERAGLVDVSTLGKIEIRGPDAVEFLDRLYVTGHLKQPVGRIRYGLMTDLTGTVTDDGIVCRLSHEHFLLTTTTTGLEAVVRSMYLWNAQWRLDVDIANVTAAYAAVNLAGPASRQILSELCRNVDLGAEAFPYLALRAGLVAGIPARLFRVGFVGELGFEIHVPAGCGEALWDALIETGRRYGLVPFGVEAQRVLRLEKGHVIVGQDTDGLTSPIEIGIVPAKTKSFFLGHAAIAAQRERGLSRRLVGFLIEGNGPVPKECHLVIDRGEIVGRVTSCVRSPAAGKIIGLAYVPPEQSEIGKTFTIRVEKGQMITATVAPLPFYDPQNERQKS